MVNTVCVENENWQKNQEKLKKKWEKHRKKKEEEYYKNPILCKFCNEPIPHSKDVKRRKFCTQSCAAAFNNKGVRRNWTEKRCLNCDILIYSGRKYCSIKCGNDYRYHVYIKKWKGGKFDGVVALEHLSAHIRRYIKEKYNHKCRKCGWSKMNKFTNSIPLHVDHKNGDCTDNREENLDLLCPSCHSLTENYGSLNKGKSKRYKLMAYKRKLRAYS